MIRFVPPLALRSLLYYLAGLIQLLGVTMAAPLLVAVLAGEWEVAAIFAGTGLGLVVGGRSLRRGPAPGLRLREALIVTALAYLVFALAGALPFLAVATFDDAFFEAMSGITTTGLSVFDPAALPASLLFFRAYSQWLGGAGIVILSLVVLIGPGRAAFRLYASEFGQDHLLGSVVATARAVLWVYLSLTALALAAFAATGMPPFEALLHALATVSTGGFSPNAESIAAYPSPLPGLAVNLFMLMGAVSFPLYYFAVRGGWRRLWRDGQLRALLTLFAAGGLLALVFEGRLERLLPSLFHAASALTTTGFTVSDPRDWPEAVRWLIVGLMAIGGSAGSTAGGLKLLRLLVGLRMMNWSLLKAMLPEEATLAPKVDGTAISEADFRQVFTLLALYLATAFGSTLLLAATGFGVAEALFEAVSALSTVGLSVGITSSELPLTGKLVLCFNMWVGRLEILPVLVLLHPATWLRGPREG